MSVPASSFTATCATVIVRFVFCELNNLKPGRTYFDLHSGRCVPRDARQTVILVAEFELTVTYGQFGGDVRLQAYGSMPKFKVFLHGRTVLALHRQYFVGCFKRSSPKRWRGADKKLSCMNSFKTLLDVAFQDPTKRSETAHVTLVFKHDVQTPHSTGPSVPRRKDVIISIRSCNRIARELSLGKQTMILSSKIKNLQNKNRQRSQHQDFLESNRSKPQGFG